MWLYAGRRIVLTIPILLGVTIICFALVKIAPGDPIQNLLSPTASAEDAARLRAAYGLDKPVLIQYFIWLGKVCVGNLGMSISDNVPVAGEVLHAFVNTVVIALISVVLAFVLSMIFGIIGAYRSGKLSDRLITAVAVFGISVPPFWLGVVLVIFFAVDLSWLPATGMGASGSEKTDYASKPGLDLFWRRYTNDDYFPIEQMAERTAVALMGVRLECAQCHKHPFDRWTQADYRSYANIFAKVEFGHSPSGLAATARLLQERRKSDPGGLLAPIPRLREVYVADRPARQLVDRSTGQPLSPRALGGPEISDAGDPRDQLFAWLKQPGNPYFAPSFVNRAWAAYFGVGLVDPVDGFSVANPPSNARLLDALSDDFVEHGFDIRRLERMILGSRSYQRSSVPSEGAADVRTYLARPSPRTLMAEVVVDILNDALGVPGDFGVDAPPGSRAIEVAANHVANPELARVFRIFGRPRRVATCDCERPQQPAVSQALFLMTDTALQDKIRQGRLRMLLESDRCDAEILEELVLATLSRLPTSDELDAGLEHLRDADDRAGAMADIVSALINTNEFVLNH